MSDAATLSMPRALEGRRPDGSRALAASVLLVAAASPFELVLPGAAGGGFQLTSLELAVMAAGLTAAAVWAVNPALPRQTAALGRPIAMAALVWLAVAATSALAAPQFQGNALRSTGRLTAAAFVAFVTSSALTTPARVRALIGLLVGVAAVVGAVAVLEAARAPAVLHALTAFRPGFHVVGGQLRATSTFIYPTIASMYLEVVFALGLAVLVGGIRPLDSAPVAHPGGRAVAKGRVDLPIFAALAIIGAGIIATFTRAGLISLAVSLAMFFGLSGCSGFAGVRRPLAALALVLVVLALVSRSPELLLLRFGTDTAQDWYGAHYQAPSRLTLRPGELADVPVTLTNLGLLPWRSDVDPPFRVSYHWLRADTEEVVQFDGLRTPFPQPVPSGARAALAARVRAPGYPGQYVLVWDVVQEHRTWLSVEGVEPARTAVAVEGRPVGAPLRSLGRLPGASNRLPRPVLWKAALAIAAEHPALGVGPDNFRLVYGRALGLASWDTRVHANNMYLETLAGSGALGLAAFLWLMAAVGRETGRRWSRLRPEDRPLLAGAAAAGVSMAGHGLVDAFLVFTPTYVVFALALGLALSPALSGRSDTLLPALAPEREQASPAAGHADRV